MTCAANRLAPEMCDCAVCMHACTSTEESLPVQMRGTTQGADTSVLISTGDKQLRRFACRHGMPAQQPSSRSQSDREGDPQTADSPAAGIQLLSGSISDLFFQGVTSEVSAMSCLDSLVVAGCKDGTVGLLDCNLPPMKAKFVAFSFKHEGPVQACFLRKSPPLLRAAVAEEQGTDSIGLPTSSAHQSTAFSSTHST